MAGKGAKDEYAAGTRSLNTKWRPQTNVIFWSPTCRGDSVFHKEPDE